MGGVLSGYIPCPAFPYQVCAAFVHAFSYLPYFLLPPGKKAGENSDGQLLPGYLLYNRKLSGYGFYYWGGFRRLFETLVPPLKGFQFNRTVFFNPFLWYAALFLLVKYLIDKRKQWLGYLVSLIALAVVILTPAVYNDFYSTCYYNAYRIIKHTQVENLNYREFYSQKLFEEIKADIGYDGEYSAAYGMHPAVLSYNGIATLDGYLASIPRNIKKNSEP